MLAILHWSDGQEERREIQADREQVYVGVRRYLSSPDDTLLVRAGRDWDGTPIFYADDSLRPTRWNFECRYDGPAHS